MTTRVCVIRHGETDWNQEHRIQGQLDIPLNKTGRTQALAMASIASDQEFSAIYSSDLTRALETAKALNQDSTKDITARPELRERHFGIFQGLSKDEANKNHPEAYTRYLARDVNYNLENGESLTEFSQRVMSIFEELRQQHSNQQLAVVCHAGLLDIMYRNTTGRTLESQRDFDIPNCALNWFHHDGSCWHLDSWGNHEHLNKVMMDSVE